MPGGGRISWKISPPLRKLLQNAIFELASSKFFWDDFRNFVVQKKIFGEVGQLHGPNLQLENSRFLILGQNRYFHGEREKVAHFTGKHYQQNSFTGYYHILVQYKPLQQNCSLVIGCADIGHLKFSNLSFLPKNSLFGQKTL